MLKGEKLNQEYSIATEVFTCTAFADYPIVDPRRCVVITATNGFTLLVLDIEIIKRTGIVQRAVA